MIDKATLHSSLVLDVRAQDYDRFLCIQLAPAAQRPALYTVTALHVELARIAELVSEPLLGHIRLAWWREALEEIMAGKVPRSHPVVEALAVLHRDSPGLLQQLRKMVNARAADLDAGLIAGEEQWLSYLDDTAGVLHSVWAQLLAAEEAVRHADVIRQQARAYAMVGLARAVPYLHAQGFTRFPAELESLAPSAELAAFILKLLASAKAALRPSLSSRALRPLRGLSRLASYHARGLHQKGGDPYRLRAAKLPLVLRILQMKICLC